MTLPRCVLHVVGNFCLIWHQEFIEIWLEHVDWLPTVLVMYIRMYMRQEKMVQAGGGKVSEQGTHKCEMNTGEGNGKPLLNNTPCVGNPSQDHQESTRLGLLLLLLLLL
jgi:hypothetical protein